MESRAVSLADARTELGAAHATHGGHRHHRVMATEDDVRTIALSLPDTDEHPSYGGRPSFRVRKKGFASLRPDGVSVTVYVGGLEDKEALLAADSRRFFTEPHYDGHPMVLVRY